MKDILEYSANSIEYVLHTHGIEGRVDGGTVSPRLMGFHLTLPLSVRPSRIAALLPAVAAALTAASCRMSVRDGVITLELPRLDPQMIKLLDLYQRLDGGEFGDEGDLPPATALLGLDSEGTPLLLRLDGQGVGNVLLTGERNGGKSALLRGMLVSLALANGPDELQMLVIDAGKRGGPFTPLDGLPHLLTPLVSDPLDAVHRLSWLARHLDWREENAVAIPRLVVAIDDAAPLLAADGRKFASVLKTLCRRGPQHGVHIIAGSRELVPALIGDNLHSNFPARVVARVSSADDARDYTGQSSSGAEQLLGAGDMLVVLEGELVRMQAAYASDAECGQVVRLMQKVAQEQQREQEREKQPLRAVRPARDLAASHLHLARGR
jgi:DNA segregation ATPase FtsK/SpoIIIE, S-DNA-T family